MRIFDWLEHLSLTATSETYVGGANNSPSYMARNISKVARAERRLRLLPDRLAEASLLLSRRASPLSGGHVEERLLVSSKRGVYDFDDALMLPRRDFLGRFIAPHRAWSTSVSAADVVIAGNETLAEAARAVGADVRVIPSCVDPTKYPKRRRNPNRNAPLAVWIGSPSSESYLAGIAGPLLRTHAETGLRLKVISSGSQSLGELEPMVDRVEWSPVDFMTELADADFGIMPLDDTPWARGKCAYKLLQYAAAELPIAGSPIGANDRVLSLANGSAPTDSAAWTEALMELARLSESETAERGSRSLAMVQQHYSFDAWAVAWSEAVFGEADA